MASSIKYPEDSCLWFIEGDNLAVLTNVDSSGNRTISERKKWKAIQESVTDGILLFYYAEPDDVTSLSDVPDVDNALHLPLVDYVKRCLYMDRAGSADDPNQASVSVNASMMHQRRWDESIKRFGVKKSEKIGGSRVIKVPSF
jgi:hypothetical protein